MNDEFRMCSPLPSCSHQGHFCGSWRWDKASQMELYAKWLRNGFHLNLLEIKLYVWAALIFFKFRRIQEGYNEISVGAESKMRRLVRWFTYLFRGQTQKVTCYQVVAKPWHYLIPASPSSTLPFPPALFVLPNPSPTLCDVYLGLRRMHGLAYPSLSGISPSLDPSENNSP
jgi:hypothetical protein